METLKIIIQNEQEKKMLLAFLNSLNYQHRTDSDDYILNDEEIKTMVKPKTDFLAGKTPPRPRNEIRQRYEGL